MLIILFYIKNAREGDTPTLALSKCFFDRNDKPEHITNLDNVVRSIIAWSEYNDRTWKNSVISMVLAQQAMGFYLKHYFLRITPPNGTMGVVFIYPNEKGGVLPHKPAIGLAFSISQRRRFLDG